MALAPSLRERQHRHLALLYGALCNLYDLTERQQADHIEAAMKLLDALGVASEYPRT